MDDYGKKGKKLEDDTQKTKRVKNFAMDVKDERNWKEN